jgi:uncharacterized protein
MRWHLSLGFLCFASVAGAQEPAPVRSLLEMRQKNVVVQQWDTSCGAAALATLLKYQHGLPASEKQIAEAMLRTGDALKVKVRGGFSLLDLKRYADAQGLEGVGFLQLSLDDLVDMAPAIVPIMTRGYPHFVVVRGRAQGKLFLADPAFGNRTLDAEAFQSAWTENIGFIVRRRDGIVPPNEFTQSPADMLRAPDAAVRSALR